MLDAAWTKYFANKKMFFKFLRGGETKLKVTKWYLQLQEISLISFNVVISQVINFQQISFFRVFIIQPVLEASDLSVLFDVLNTNDVDTIESGIKVIKTILKFVDPAIIIDRFVLNLHFIEIEKSLFNAKMP